MKLMYITNNDLLASIAEESGVDWIFIDLEINGKVQRQSHLDSVISKHNINDIRKIKKILKKSELLVRINPIYNESKKEINKVIDNGADIIMLPFYKTVNEVQIFLENVNGRAKTCLLCETKEAVEIMDDILKLKGIDYIHIGLNDMHISYNLSFMFELLSNGTVEKLCNKISESNITYGFGGIAQLGSGRLPATLILGEHFRLGSNMVILSRSFFDYKKSDLKNNISEIKDIFQKGVDSIRKFEAEILTKSNTYLMKNKLELDDNIYEIVREIDNYEGNDESLNSEDLDITHVSPYTLTNIVYKTLINKRVANTEATNLSNCIIESEIRGVTSHGLRILPAHLKKIDKNNYNLQSKNKIIKQTAAFAVIDADNGIGLTTARYAMNFAIEKAKDVGIFSVFSRNCNTYGAAFYYSMLAAEQGMIGITFSNSPASMSAGNTKEKLLGTNPLAISVPANEQHMILLDMATSIVAKSKINKYLLKSMPIPEGWALDIDGKPTTDPLEAIKGYILPMAGHKGFGLSLAIDILAGVLSGAAYLNNVGKFYNEDGKCMNVGHTFIAVDPKIVFGDEFYENMDEYILKIRNSEKLNPGDIILPGDIEYKKKQINIKYGIPISRNLIKEIIKLSDL